MRLETFEIGARVKRRAISVASVTDFESELAATGCDPETLLISPLISPYCIDAGRGEVIFVELPPEIDLTRVPFVYEAQYHNARRLHRIGIEDFIDLAANLPVSARALFLHSTGRCGSTLLARRLAEEAGVTTLSEPDVFSQLAMAGRLGSPAARDQFIKLYASLLRYFMRGRSGSVVFKFRALVSEHWDYLAEASPGSTSIFLYRDAAQVAFSYARVTGRPLSGWHLGEREIRAWSRFSPILRSLKPPVTGYDLMAALWAGPVLHYLDGWPTGIWSGAIDYADLVEDPDSMISAILGAEVPEQKRAGANALLFDAHSQAGTHLEPGLTIVDPQLEDDLEPSVFGPAIALSLRRIDSRLRAGLTLPGTF